MKRKNPTARRLPAFTLGIWVSGLVYGHCFFNPSKTIDARAVANTVSPNIVVEPEHSSFGGHANAGEPLVHSLQVLTKGESEDPQLPFYGYRYYNASTGRWLSRDPMSSESALPRDIERDHDEDEHEASNELAHVNNNPLSTIDALGLWPSSSPFLGILIGGTPLTHQKAVSRQINGPNGDVIVIQLFDKEADDEPYQDVSFSYRHAMRNARANESSDAARDRANRYVRDELSEAEDDLCNGDAASYLHALQHFGLALHTVQDSTSPAHRRRNGEFKPWYGVKWYNPVDDQRALQHVLHENFDPGYGSHLDKATADLYEKYFKCRKCASPLPDDFFTYGVDRGWWIFN